MKIPHAASIRVVRCHRLGYPKNDRRRKPRSIIIKFDWYGDRQKVWEQRKELHGRNLYVNEDFPKEIKKQRQTLTPIMHAAKKQGKKASLSVNRLVIESKSYTVESLKELPAELKPETVTTLQNEHCVAFCNELSPLSNFHHCQVQLSGEMFHSAEQAYQHRKATHCGDEVKAQRILLADSPLECKQIGDSVQTTNTDWDSVQLDIMKTCVTAKFQQNPHLADFLKSTGKKRLGEATRHPFWGVGLSLKSPNLLNTNFWTGANQLGKILTELRSQLDEQE